MKTQITKSRIVRPCIDPEGVGHPAHERDPRSQYRCRRCSNAVFFTCPTCGEIVADLEERTEVVPSYRVMDGGSKERKFYVPFETCPQCKKKLWEICSWNDTDGTKYYGIGANKSFLSTLHYRALVKASGRKPRARAKPKPLGPATGVKAVYTVFEDDEKLKAALAVHGEVRTFAEARACGELPS